MKVQVTVYAPWRPLLSALSQRLASRGFEQRETFNLQQARRALRAGETVHCPHHGADVCTCQYLVLRVGRPGQNGSTIVMHGNDRVTRVGLISAVHEKLDEALAAEIYESVRHRGQYVGTTRGTGVVGTP
jgi:hypothetical protein